MRWPVVAALLIASVTCRSGPLEQPPVEPTNYALRFGGTGTGDIDRVKIRVDDPATSAPGPAVDIGATDLTLEFWVRADPGDNGAAAISCGANTAWINGNVLLDRDRFNQDRKFGMSLGAGRVVFGVSGPGTGDLTVCGTSRVDDGGWHHVAVTRVVASGAIALYLDGVREGLATTGPAGDISYPDNGVPGNFCGGPCTNSDPFLVLGAEKHDAGPQYPSFTGDLDELRLSTAIRYARDFQPPTRAFTPDGQTAALYHFDEGAGTTVTDATTVAGAPTDGQVKVGGAPPRPIWTPSTAPTSK